MSIPNFTYTLDIPFETDTPAEDQPGMKINTNSISSLISADHVGFNTNYGGFHEQVTFNDIQNPPTIADPRAVLYSTNYSTRSTGGPQGSASGKPQLAYTNSVYTTNALGIVKAWGLFTIGSSPSFPITVTQQNNIALSGSMPFDPLITRTSAGVYVVTMVSGVVVTPPTYGVLITCAATSSSPKILSASYIANSATQFTIYVNSMSGSTAVFADPAAITFEVIQY